MTTGTIRCGMRVLAIVLLWPVRSVHAAEGIELDSLKQEVRNLGEPATRAKVRLKFAGRDGAAQAERLEQGLSQLQAALGRLEEADYPLRMAISKVDRVRRDMESKEREVARIKQYYVAQAVELKRRDDALLRAKQDIESRYSAELTEEQAAARERERIPHNLLCDRLEADAKRIAGEEQRDIEQAILNWTVAQREFGAAEVKRDQLREAANGLLQDYAAARELVVTGVNAAAQVSRPGAVPLTPFSGNGVAPAQAGLPPRQRGPIQSGTNPLEQLGGVVVAGEIARGQSGEGGGSRPASLRFDTPEGPSGQAVAVSGAPVPVGVALGEPPGGANHPPVPGLAPVEEKPLPPQLVELPKVKALTVEREENARQLAEFRTLQREIANHPDQYDQRAMTTVTENLSRVANKDVALRYMAETAKGGSESMDLEFTIVKPPKRTEPPVPK